MNRVRLGDFRRARVSEGRVLGKGRWRIKNLLAGNEDERMNEMFALIFVKRIFIYRQTLKPCYALGGCGRSCRVFL